MMRRRIAAVVEKEGTAGRMDVAEASGGRMIVEVNAGRRFVGVVEEACVSPCPSYSIASMHQRLYPRRLYFLLACASVFSDYRCRGKRRNCPRRCSVDWSALKMGTLADSSALENS